MHEAVMTSTDTGGILKACAGEMKGVTLALTAGKTEYSSTGEVLKLCMDGMKAVTQALTVLSAATARMGTGAPNAQSAGFFEKDALAKNSGEVAAVVSLCPSPYRARVPKKKPARALAGPDTSDAGGQAVPTAAASSCPPIPDECDAQPSTQHVDVAQPDTSEAGGQAVPTAGDADAGDAID